MTKYQSKQELSPIPRDEGRYQLSSYAVRYGYNIEQIVWIYNKCEKNIETVKTALEFIEKFDMNYKLFNYKLFNQK